MNIKAISLAAILLLASVSVLQSAHAAEITCIDTYANARDIIAFKPDFFKKWFPSGRLPKSFTCNAVLIRGDIINGDSINFINILRENHPFLDTVYLASSGGSVDEGIKIGRLVRKYMLTTEAPYHIAFSPKLVDERLRFAHPLIIAETVQKAEDSHPGDAEFVEAVRIKAERNFSQSKYSKIEEAKESYRADEGSLLLYNGDNQQTNICRGADCHCASACFLIWSAGVIRGGSTIGIHRPSIHSPEFGNLPPDQASNMYKQELANINQYLSDMEIPQKYIFTMTETASNDIYWLEDDEAHSMEKYPPSIAESMSASCGSQDKNEVNAMSNTELKEAGGFPVSQQEKAIYKKLDDKRHNLLECVLARFNKYRDSIASVE